MKKIYSRWRYHHQRCLLGVDWKISTENALKSKKDMKHELLKEYYRFMVKDS